jgi:quercetin dioxygenase-like cupin family protein
MATKTTLPPAEALVLRDLIAPTDHGIASRILTKASGGNVTLFAFDQGQGLSEHTAPFDALVMVLDGRLDLTVGGARLTALPGTVVLMPANLPHALEAPEPTRMVLTMVRETASPP